MYDFAVFIGRFQPFHTGHLHIVEEALKQSDRLIMVIGSANRARSTRNPWTASERIDFIKTMSPPTLRSRVLFTTSDDHLYNTDRWIAGVQRAVFDQVESVGGFSSSLPAPMIALAGMYKDHTSFYLNLFPSWGSINITPKDVQHSTDIRHNLFTKQGFPSVPLMPSAAIDLLRNEYRYEQNYSENWGEGPHLTVDAAVVQSGHILLVQRGQEYGHKKWAFPGGFMEKNETLADATIRELREETHIKVPEKVLRGSVVCRKVYDDPHRSARGRIITQATYFHLKDGKLPSVRGDDDVELARWFSLSQAATMSSVMFEDHYDMLTDLVGI